MTKDMSEQVDQISRMILESTHQYSYFKAIRDLATFVKQKDWREKTHREWGEHEARMLAVTFLVRQMEPRFRELGYTVDLSTAGSVAQRLVDILKGTQQGRPE